MANARRRASGAESAVSRTSRNSERKKAILRNMMADLATDAKTGIVNGGR